MSDEKMTAEQAWAEADRLDAESDVASVTAQESEIEARRNRIKANALIDRWLIAVNAAEAIGPRPVKVPS